MTISEYKTPESPHAGERFTKILVPLDFSPVSRLALRYSVAMARRLGSKLVLLHVVESYMSLTPTLDEAAVIEKEHFLQARRILPSLVTREETTSLHIVSIVKTGDVAEKIAATVESEHAGLVVMGTHGRGVLARTLIGSTTKEVAERIQVPLLTVCHPVGSLRFKTILLVTDLSEESVQVAKTVFEISRISQAGVILLHVAKVELESGAEAAVYLGDSRRQKARSKMDEFRKMAPSQHIETAVVIAEDSVANTVLRFAGNHGADIIAVGFRSLDMGVEDVIRGAKVPVLCVPAP